MIILASVGGGTGDIPLCLTPMHFFPTTHQGDNEFTHNASGADNDRWGNSGQITPVMDQITIIISASVRGGTCAISTMVDANHRR